MSRIMNIHSNTDFVVSHLLDVHWFLIDCTGLVDDGATHNGKFLGIFLSIFHLCRLLLLGETENQQ